MHIHQGDYLPIKDNIILVCPFCKKKMLIEERRLSKLSNRLTVNGPPYDPYIEHCGNLFKIVEGRVITKEEVEHIKIVH